MKKSVFLIMSFFIAATVCAQTDNTQGQVKYEVVRKFEIKIQGGDAAQFQNMLPKERKSNKELIFNADASLYQAINSNQDEEAVHETQGGAVMIKMMEPNEIIYSDIKSKINLEQREFMTRNFLVETITDTAQWKMTGNQKAILGFNCMEAELVGSKKKTIAWFTPMIPVSTGPDGYTGLPGLILLMDIEDGKTTYTAQNVDLKEVDPSLLKKPKDGKRVTRKEFNKIVEEKRKEMNMGQGDGATVIIRTTR